MGKLELSTKQSDELEILKHELCLDGISNTIRGATPKDYYNEGQRDLIKDILEQVNDIPEVMRRLKPIIDDIK